MTVTFQAAENDTYDIYLMSDTVVPTGHDLGQVVATGASNSLTVSGAAMAALNLVDAEDYYIKVINNTTPSKWARSYDFTVVQSMTGIEITAPASGTDYKQGESVTINWESINNLTDDGNDPS